MLADGYADLLLRNSRGEPAIWEVYGTIVIVGAGIGNSDARKEDPAPSPSLPAKAVREIFIAR